MSHVDGQQKLSKQRRLVIRQDGQDHSFCHIGQHSSPGNRDNPDSHQHDPSLTKTDLVTATAHSLVP